MKHVTFEKHRLNLFNSNANKGWRHRMRVVLKGGERMEERQWFDLNY